MTREKRDFRSFRRIVAPADGSPSALRIADGRTDELVPTRAEARQPEAEARQAEAEARRAAEERIRELEAELRERSPGT